jgi:hypothetical protein
MNATYMIVAGIAIFLLGGVCGAGMVYRFRHVTTKALPEVPLNTLHDRTARLDLLSGPVAESEEEIIELVEDQTDLESQ